MGCLHALLNGQGGMGNLLHPFSHYSTKIVVIFIVTPLLVRQPKESFARWINIHNVLDPHVPIAGYPTIVEAVVLAEREYLGFMFDTQPTVMIAFRPTHGYMLTLGSLIKYTYMIMSHPFPSLNTGL